MDNMSKVGFAVKMVIIARDVTVENPEKRINFLDYIHLSETTSVFYVDEQSLSDEDFKEMISRLRTKYSVLFGTEKITLVVE